MEPLEWIMLGSVIVSLIANAYASYQNKKTSKEINEQNIEANKDLQEDSQQFAHVERLAQNQYEQQMHEFNVVNDQLLKYDAFKGLGMSSAGALQALSGAPSVGYSPSASNSTAGSNGVNLLGNAGLYSNFADLLPSIVESMKGVTASQKDVSDIDVNKSNIAYTQQMVDESQRRMEKIANDMNIDKIQLDLAKQIAASQIGLNASQVELNNGKLVEISNHITEMMAHVNNLDAQTAAAYAQASLYVSQSGYYSSMTGLVDAQTQNTYIQGDILNEQLYGEHLNNLDKETVVSLKQFRLEISKALGIDVDAPLTTQLVESMIMGRFDTTAKLIESSMIVSPVDSKMKAERAFKFTELKAHEKPSRSVSERNTKSLFKNDVYKMKIKHGYSSPSFQSTWNPNH